MHFTFRSMIHFELIFMKDLRPVSRFFFGYAVLLATFIEQTIFTPLYYLYFCVKDQLIIFIGVYFWALCSLPLIYEFVFMLVPYNLNYYSLVIELEIRERDTLSIILSQDCFDFPELFISVLLSFPPVSLCSVCLF